MLGALIGLGFGPAARAAEIIIPLYLAPTFNAAGVLQLRSNGTRYGQAADALTVFENTYNVLTNGYVPTP